MILALVAPVRNTRNAMDRAILPDRMGDRIDQLLPSETGD